jgi:hypothetical protein
MHACAGSHRCARSAGHENTTAENTTAVAQCLPGVSAISRALLVPALPERVTTDAGCTSAQRQIWIALYAVAVDIGKRTPARAQLKPARMRHTRLSSLGTTSGSRHAAQKRANAPQLLCKPPVERRCARRGAMLSCMRRAACQPGSQAAMQCSVLLAQPTRSLAALQRRVLQRRTPARVTPSGSVRSPISAGASPHAHPGCIQRIAP